MRKIKDTFDHRQPVPSVPSVPSNSAFGLAVVCEHWTPKGDCKVTGNKEIPSNIKEIPLKLNRHKNSKIDNSPSNYIKPLTPRSTSLPFDYIRNSFKIYLEQF